MREVQTHSRVDGGTEEVRCDYLFWGKTGLPKHLKDLLEKPQETPEGFLIVEGFSARAGNVQIYGSGENQVHVYRPASVVFSAESLASYEGKPVTNGHPVTPGHPERGLPRDLIATEDAHKHSVGAVLKVVPLPEHGLCKVRYILHDKQAIADFKAGKSALSCGQKTTETPTPGKTPEGVPFHTSTTSITINHMALVTQGRAGPLAVSRIDSKHNTPHPGEGSMEEEIVIGGVTYKVPKAVADAYKARCAENESLKKERDQARADMGGMKAERDNARSNADTTKAEKEEAEKKASKFEARADEYEAKSKKLQEKVKELEEGKSRNDGEETQELIQKRTSLIVKALPFTGLEVEKDGEDGKTTKVRLDSMSEEEILRAAIQTRYPDLPLEGKSLDYLHNRLDVMSEDAGTSTTSISRLDNASRASRGSGASLFQARDKALQERDSNPFK